MMGDGGHAGQLVGLPVDNRTIGISVFGCAAIGIGNADRSAGIVKLVGFGSVAVIGEGGVIIIGIGNAQTAAFMSIGDRAGIVIYRNSRYSALLCSITGGRISIGDRTPVNTTSRVSVELFVIA